jgi:DNA-binding HxlR family transcriptional regulator
MSRKKSLVTQRLLECPVKKSMDALGGKWKLLIINTFEGQTRRYGELKKLLPEISEKMLIQELKELVAEGIVERKAYHEIPPRVEYALTQKGKQTQPIIDALYHYGVSLLKTKQVTKKIS